MRLPGVARIAMNSLLVDPLNIAVAMAWSSSVKGRSLPETWATVSVLRYAV